MSKPSPMAPVVADHDFVELANYRHKMVSVEMKYVQQTFNPPAHKRR